MLINLDEIVRTRGDWDFKLQVDGRDLATREVTEADMAELAAALKARDTAAAQKALAGFFVEPPPGLEAWGTERVTLVVAALSAYIAERLSSLAEQAQRHVTSMGKAERAKARRE